MASKAVQIIEGQWSVWRRSERWVCCDCSLVHRVEYRIRDGQLQVRMFRENRSTAMYRRHDRVIVKRKPKKSVKPKSR